MAKKKKASPVRRRRKAPDRRYSQTRVVTAEMDNGAEVRILVTIDFADADMTKPTGVFCASFKTGVTMNTIVMDTCVLISRLLQWGDSVDKLVGTVTPAPALIGAIVKSLRDTIDESLLCLTPKAD